MVGGTGRTPKGLSDHLGAHGSSLRTGQAKFRAYVPGDLTPPPTKGLMAIVLIADIAEKLSSFDVGENVQYPGQFAVDAVGREHYSREEGTAKVTVTVSKRHKHQQNTCHFNMAVSCRQASSLVNMVKYLVDIIIPCQQPQLSC